MNYFGYLARYVSNINYWKDVLLSGEDFMKSEYLDSTSALRNDLEELTLAECNSDMS